MNTIQREAKARRQLAKWELRLNKAPSRHWTRKEYGVGYQLLKGNMVVDGCCQREYEMTLEQVEEQVKWLAKMNLEDKVRNALSDFIDNGGDPQDAASIGGKLFNFVQAGRAM